MVTPNDYSVKITDGEVWINGYPFSTDGYQPPHWPRAISYEDTVTSSTYGLTPVRYVTDLGPTLRVWKPFTILCFNNDHFDGPIAQPWRGQQMYENLMHLFSDFIGTPLVLLERWTNTAYNVMFAQDGLDPSWASPAQVVDPDNRTGMGPEYKIQVSFFEVSV